MRHSSGILGGFAMDTATLAGPLEAKLAAMAGAGFSQLMLSAGDLASHPGGVPAAVQAVQVSGLRPVGFQALRDFEGLSGHLHAYKVDIAKSLLEMCQALGSPVLLASSSTSHHASSDPDAIARDLRKLAMLALPLGIRVAYDALSWGRRVKDFSTAWDVVCQADCPNLGLGLDSFHIFADETPLDALEDLDASRIFLVQLSDFMWHDASSADDPSNSARSFRVFPGEGVHSEVLADLVLRLDAIGYQGDYSFAVCNQDYLQLPLPTVAERARRSALWLREEVLLRSAPLPLP
ncbi:xylose isomerase [Rhodoferax lacus]|uniref:Xylose isomerase n=1 Tax=Rhodoferax lacus TaxID=2184758 RepID=A0A3E1RF88_9BURK|nr:sugar phosphate isomerase/epimerase [Rhodoferax lacus]RFO97260.1 xylose isomerase [Rhodoferax lacus]